MCSNALPFVPVFLLPNRNRATAAPLARKRPLATELPTLVRKLPETAVTGPPEPPLQGTEPQTRVATARTGEEPRPKDARTGATGLTKMISHCARRAAFVSWVDIGTIVVVCLTRMKVSSYDCDLLFLQKLIG